MIFWEASYNNHVLSATQQAFIHLVRVSPLFCKLIRLQPLVIFRTLEIHRGGGPRYSSSELGRSRQLQLLQSHLLGGYRVQGFREGCQSCE